MIEGVYVKKEKNNLLTICIAYFLGICILTVALIVMDRFQIGGKIGLSKNYDWLSFLGTCLSSFVAVTIPVYVMFHTISNQKKDDEVKRKSEMVPVLQIKIKEKQGLFERCKINFGDIDDESCEFGNKHDAICLDKESECVQDWSVLLKIKNVGNSYAKNIFYSLKVNGKNRNIQSDSLYRVVGKDDLDKCYLNFRVKDYQGCYSVEFTITYEDMFDKKYMQQIKFDLKECKMSNVKIHAPMENDDKK